MMLWAQGHWLLQPPRGPFLDRGGGACSHGLGRGSEKVFTMESWACSLSPMTDMPSEKQQWSPKAQAAMGAV